MQLINPIYIAVTICCLIHQGIYISAGYVTLTHDGPTVRGGIITFQADLHYDYGSRPSGTFDYFWRDDAIPSHKHEVLGIKNTTNIWQVQYPADLYPVGEYTVEIKVRRVIYFILPDITSQHRTFEITSLLNGNMTIVQSNNTVNNDYVSSASEAEVKINLRKGDAEYIDKNATEIETHWFVNCKYYGQTNDYTFRYNFTKPDSTALIEALVIASFEPPTTIVPSTITTSIILSTNTTTIASNSNNSTIFKSNSTIIESTTPSTAKNLTNTSVKPTESTKISNDSDVRFPYVCVNSSVIPDPKKTYGYFRREVQVKVPIKNITVEGTNWIKPWDMLSLNVTCHGSGPFYQCLEYHRGNYNITGNETCEKGSRLESCNFSITHYFLDPTVYTIVVILKNDISKLVYPLTINIYEVTTKPQLSVIVVPVSCSLAAVVLIVFGIAYYLQSRARFTVEVADFDFGQNNPELEYKTFTERLRDSFNSTGYKPLSEPKIQN
ncbi:uncharacterized protein [Chelonus insularis]|uniref:uncharacterized protein n=1 Tax=Chelonus insularis TaxID=460826 RepID=UPI00158EBD3E|nr:uncharacterized protein LOC118065169 [Chelonus insularis]